MFMLGSKLKAAAIFLVLVLSLYSQVGLEEESTLVANKGFGNMNMVKLQAEADMGGSSGNTVIGEELHRDIGLKVPATVLDIGIPVENKDGFIDTGDLAQISDAPTVREDGNSFSVEELRLFCSGPAWYLVGRLKNTGQHGAELTLVTWEVGGEDKEVLASAGGYVRFLNPGEIKPFKLMVPLRTDVTWCRLQVTPGFKAKLRPVELQGSAETYADRGAAYISLLGQVSNHGSERQDFIKVMVEFLDECGRLLDVDWAFLNYLDPGQSQSFTVYTPHLQTSQWQLYFD